MLTLGPLNSLCYSPDFLFKNMDRILDHSVVTEEEVRGWYSFGVATEGLSSVAISIFYIILLENLASNVAFQNANPKLPCDVSVEGYSCSVNVFGFTTSTSSIVFCIL